MADSSINVAVDYPGKVIPREVRPVATYTQEGLDYQQVMTGPIPPYDKVHFEYSGALCTSAEYSKNGVIVCTITYTYNGSDQCTDIEYSYAV